MCLFGNYCQCLKQKPNEFGYNLKAKSKPVENVLSDSAELVKEPKELEFFVKDTGIAIQQGKKKVVFERFIQADIGDIRVYQWAGLGLSITKAYVEMLGGEIWVESEEGKGSIFYFTIPYITETIEMIAVENVVSLEEEPNGIKKLKILIVDDDESSAMLLKEIVKNYSKEVLNAETGVEACRSNPALDLVLMDIQMPVMDGLEATVLIRQFNKDVIIIAQTAYALVGDKVKTKNAGFNDYVSKPINR